MLNNFYKNKKILVTGHTGFKGSWLSLWLKELGAHVTGYALKPPTDPSLFDACRLEDKITSTLGDVRNYRSLKDTFEKYQPEMVFHMAAQPLVRYSYREPVKTYETNIMGTVNMLEACRNTPSVRAIVNVTSDKCYENKEEIWSYKENDSIGGYDPYSSSKGCAELISNSYARSFFNPSNYKQHGVALATARAGNVIGGGDWAEDRIIPDCIRSLQENKPVILRYPNAIRPWQHVLEPLYGYLLLGQHLYEFGQEFIGAWNFGPNDENAQPVRWVIEQITKLWGTRSFFETDQNVSPHETKYLRLDSSKAKSNLGWYPVWDFHYALTKTVEWYKAYYSDEPMASTTIKQIHEYEESIFNKINQYELQVL